MPLVVQSCSHCSPNRQSRIGTDGIDTTLHFHAKPGDPSYGILQNRYLMERAEIKDFTSSFTFNADGTFSYESDLLMRLAATGAEMHHHTDKNTLHRVKRIHPSVGLI